MTENKREQFEEENEEHAQGQQQDLAPESPAFVPTSRDFGEAGKNQRQEAVQMPEDFVEPEGKKSKWKTVKGEVEIEGKKVEITYREKIIKLPKHRQEQTGIKRIRRRELLPPFPKGLVTTEQEGYCYNARVGENQNFYPFYKFFTDETYPRPGTWVHAIEQGLTNRSNNFDAKKRMEKIKKEGLYFQEISRYVELQHEKCFVNKYKTPIFIFGERNHLFSDYAKSVLNNSDAMQELTSRKQPKYRLVEVDSDEYKDRKQLYSEEEFNRQKKQRFKAFLLDEERGEPLDIVALKIGRDSIPVEFPLGLVFPVVKRWDIKPLRWCHAECALVPTKRGLNVLFFETGDEYGDEYKDKKEQ